MTKVPPGSVVRVFFHPGSPTFNHLTVDYGGAANVTLSVFQSAEFVFYVDGGTGKWLVTQANTTSTV